MRTVSFTLIFFLVISGISSGQTKEESKQQNSPVAQISYNGSISPRICFAIYADGTYLLSRKSTLFTPVNPGEGQYGREVVQGTLTKEELQHFAALLRNLRSNPGLGGPVLEKSEWFIAEISQKGSSKRYTWVNGDHRDPFPGSIRKVIRWMQDFKAENSTVITLHELSSIPSPCPSLSEDRFQPIIAGLNPDQTGGSCRAKR